MRLLPKLGLILTVFACLLTVASDAADKTPGKTSLTIYNPSQPGSISPNFYRAIPGNDGWAYGSQVPGYAMIREQREIDLKSGINSVKFSDVAAYIDPTTVAFKSLTDPVGTAVLEQDYHFDLVSNQKLLERYLGQDVTVEQASGNSIQTMSGKLLSATGGLILQDQTGKVTSINSYTNVRFPELPGGLITKPTLMWSVLTEKAGKHNVETSYRTDGITWWADYNAVYQDDKDANSGFLDLGAWVSIINKSGASYNDAKLKLVAGNVNRIEARGGRADKLMMMESRAAAPMADEGFAEKAFFEFHLYTLGRSTTIPDNSTKQIELFPKVTRVPVEKQFVYYGAAMPYYGGTRMEPDLGIPMNKKVDVYIKFKNDKKAGMGMPLPAGRLRVNKQDDDGSLEFIGEDTIDHTPKDEDVMLKLGQAFDVTGERKQTDFKVDVARRTIDESFEIVVKNHKDSDVKVIVKESLYRAANWEIQNNSGEFEKIDSHTVHFPVTVKRDGSAKVTYSVHYSW